MNDSISYKGAFQVVFISFTVKTSDTPQQLLPPVMAWTCVWNVIMQPLTPGAAPGCGCPFSISVVEQSTGLQQNLQTTSEGSEWLRFVLLLFSGRKCSIHSNHELLLPFFSSLREQQPLQKHQSCQNTSVHTWTHEEEERKNNNPARKCSINSPATSSHSHCLVINWDWNQHLSQQSPSQWAAAAAGTPVMFLLCCISPTLLDSTHTFCFEWVNLVFGTFFFSLQQKKVTKSRAEAPTASWAGHRPAESIWSPFSELTIQMLTNSI